MKIYFSLFVLSLLSFDRSQSGGREWCEWQSWIQIVVFSTQISIRKIIARNVRSAVRLRVGPTGTPFEHVRRIHSSTEISDKTVLVLFYRKRIKIGIKEHNTELTMRFFFLRFALSHFYRYKSDKSRQCSNLKSVKQSCIIKLTSLLPFISQELCVFLGEIDQMRIQSQTFREHKIHRWILIISWLALIINHVQTSFSYCK